MTDAGVSNDSTAESRSEPAPPDTSEPAVEAAAESRSEPAPPDTSEPAVEAAAESRSEPAPPDTSEPAVEAAAESCAGTDVVDDSFDSGSGSSVNQVVARHAPIEAASITTTRTPTLHEVVTPLLAVARELSSAGPDSCTAAPLSLSSRALRGSATTVSSPSNSPAEGFDRNSLSSCGSTSIVASSSNRARCGTAPLPAEAASRGSTTIVSSLLGSTELADSSPEASSPPIGASPLKRRSRIFFNNSSASSNVSSSCIDVTLGPNPRSGGR